jgi:heat shock protein HtpX
VTLQQQIRRNRFRSSIVVFGFVLLLVVLAGLVGLVFDISLGVVALAAALVYALFGILRSRSMISGITHAQPLGEDELRPLRRIVENVSIGAGLPATPELRVVDDVAPNAFAAGLRPASSYVGVTTGLLQTMPKRELEAVIAHEVAHIRNRDTYLMTMATVFAGVIALVADIGLRTLAYGGRGRRAGAIGVILALVGFVLAPYAALMLRLSLSRSRELLADSGAAEILSDPEAMAMALRRLELDTTTVRYTSTSTAHLWVESPTDRIGSERGTVLEFTSWFNTHPPIRTRISALEQAGGFRLPEVMAPDTPFAVELGLA